MSSLGTAAASFVLALGQFYLFDLLRDLFCTYLFDVFFEFAFQLDGVDVVTTNG